MLSVETATVSVYLYQLSNRFNDIFPFHLVEKRPMWCDEYAREEGCLRDCFGHLIIECPLPEQSKQL
eukprot:scaffold23518_cov225-Skeletonema_marinoi.AAC.12